MEEIFFRKLVNMYKKLNCQLFAAGQRCVFVKMMDMCTHIFRLVFLLTAIAIVLFSFFNKITSKYNFSSVYSFFCESRLIYFNVFL